MAEKLDKNQIEIYINKTLNVIENNYKYDYGNKICCKMFCTS